MSGDDDATQRLVPLDDAIRADQWDALEAIARQTGATRGQVLRRLLDLGLAAERAAEDPPTS